MLDITRKLLETLGDKAARDLDLTAAAQAFLDATRQASAGEVHAAMQAFAGGFRLEDLGRAGFSALVAGSLVERGFDPSAIAGPLLFRLGRLLCDSATFVEACEQEMPPSPDEEDDPAARFEQA